MAFNCRIYTYRGMIQVQQRMVKQFNSDSVFLLDEPYIGAQLMLVPSGGAAVMSGVFAVPDDSQILRLEVPDGSQVRYEINPNGPNASTTKSAGALSPRTSGFTNFPWGKGYTLSLCDASVFL